MQMNGFAIVVMPDRHPSMDDFMVCRATIYSSKREVVFDEYDEQFDIVPVTGKDVNGDGQPDAVLESYSGGAHCCYTYHIISLGENPGLIRTFKNEQSATFEDLDGDGRIEIKTRDGNFDYFPGSYAGSSQPLVILRLEGDKFEDVASEFLSLYDDEIARSRDKLATLPPPENPRLTDYR